MFYFFPKDVRFIGPTDNEVCKLACRRAHPDLDRLNHYSFADPAGELVDGFGMRDQAAGVALRATFLVDPVGMVRRIEVNALNVGRYPAATRRVRNALQIEQLCGCNRAVGDDVLQAG